MRLYWVVARRALQRQRAYRTENLAGLVTDIEAIVRRIYEQGFSTAEHEAPV
jgi:hypothetical protein